MPVQRRRADGPSGIRIRNDSPGWRCITAGRPLPNAGAGAALIPAGWKPCFSLSVGEGPPVIEEGPMIGMHWSGDRHPPLGASSY